MIRQEQDRLILLTLSLRGHKGTAFTNNPIGGTLMSEEFSPESINDLQPGAEDNSAESSPKELSEPTADTGDEAEKSTGLTEEAKAQSETTTRFRLRAPAIIAAVILLATVLCFACWGIFFNRSLHGKWTLDFTVSDKDYSVTLEFNNDGTCYFHNGGMIYKGNYTTSEDQNGRSKLRVNCTSFGQPFISSDFYYEFSGNAITGRKLVLTDLSGLIFSPDDLSEESTQASDSKKSAADYLEENGKRYYIYALDSNDSYETKLSPLDGAIDEKLTGIWLESSADSNYDNTFAFNADGTYQITYRDLIYKGCYAAKDGSCVFNLVSLDGTVANNALDYTFDEDKLVITVNDVPATLVPTDNIYAFDTGIK